MIMHLKFRWILKIRYFCSLILYFRKKFKVFGPKEKTSTKIWSIHRFSFSHKAYEIFSILGITNFLNPYHFWIFFNAFLTWTIQCFWRSSWAYTCLFLDLLVAINRFWLFYCLQIFNNLFIRKNISNNIRFVIQQLSVSIASLE